MMIGDLITASAVIELTNAGKRPVLSALCRCAAAALPVAEEEILRAVVKREDLGSTGIGHGIAIPHARLAELDRPFGALAVVRPAAEFGSIDDRPVDLVFLLLTPDRMPEGPLKPMVWVARRLRDPTRVDTLRKARGAAAIFEALVGGPI